MPALSGCEEKYFNGYKVDKEKCIKCRDCINNCPTKNIEYTKSR